MSQGESVKGKNKKTFLVEKKDLTEQKEALVSDDYYWENGYMVFTEAYHKKRGYCCNSGCRHCPYGETKE